MSGKFWDGQASVLQDSDMCVVTFQEGKKCWVSQVSLATELFYSRRTRGTQLGRCWNGDPLDPFQSLLPPMPGLTVTSLAVFYLFFT